MKEICLDILCGLSVLLGGIAIAVSIGGIVYLFTTYAEEALCTLVGLLLIWLLYVIGHDIRST